MGCVVAFVKKPNGPGAGGVGVYMFDCPVLLDGRFLSWSGWLTNSVRKDGQ